MVCLFIAAVPILHQGFQFAHEGGNIGEGTVHRSKADVSHFIQLLQFFHHHFTNLAGGDFGLQVVIGQLFDGIDNAVNFCSRNRALMAGSNNTVAQFLGIKELTAVVLFNDQQLLHFHLFVSGEAAAAVDAFTAAANGITVIGGAGVYNAAVSAITELAFHTCTILCFVGLESG